MGWKKGDKLQDGKYEILDALGIGASAKVYRAVCKQPKFEIVAIKTLHDWQQQTQNLEELERYKERLVREGNILKQLSHPNIVKFRELFEENGVPCLVIDFINGKTLYQLVEPESLSDLEVDSIKPRGKPLSSEKTVSYGRQLAKALIAIHEAGLIHCDIHPGNILIPKSSNKAILIDFSIAQQIGTSIQTSTDLVGNIRGNPKFAPYELEQGIRNPAVDIYSLAATLFYAVTGKKPIPSKERREKSALEEDEEEIFEIQGWPVQHLLETNGFLNKAIIEGTALEAENRPQSMGEWLDLLVDPDTPLDKWFKIFNQQKKSENRILKVEYRSKKAVSSLQKAISSPQKAIPRGWLAISLLVYGAVGIFLLIIPASPWMFAETWVLSLVLAGLGALSATNKTYKGWRVENESKITAKDIGIGCFIFFLGGILTIVWVLYVATQITNGAVNGAVDAVENWVKPVAWIFTKILAGSTAVWIAIVIIIVMGERMIKGGEELIQSFNKLLTFQILAWTCTIGLGLSWLVGLILHFTVYARLLLP